MPTEPINGGGNGTSPAPYTILASGPAVELTGTTDVQDVIEATVQAQESGVVFHIRILTSAYDPLFVQQLAGGYAGYFDAMVKIAGVAAVNNYQDINAGNQIYDVMEVVVTSTSGKSVFPMTSEAFGRNLDEVAAAVADTRKMLDSIETGT